MIIFTAAGFCVCCVLAGFLFAAGAELFAAAYRRRHAKKTETPATASEGKHGEKEGPSIAEQWEAMQRFSGLPRREE